MGCVRDERLRVFVAEALKGRTGDENVVGILQSRAVVTAEGGPISKPGGQGDVGWKLGGPSVELNDGGKRRRSTKVGMRRRGNRII